MARLEYDFDRVVDRTNTNSIKWNFCEELFGAPDVLPMWVADMDFKTPQPVIDALVQVAEHGIYGYSKMRDNYYQAVTSWSLNQHGWELNPDWIVFSPGIVPALSWLIKAFTVPGDKVVLQSPVYPPFFKAAEKNGCQVLNNQLVLEDGRYTMDFVDLEEKLADGAKLLLLCSPHNPVGRVWRREELQRVGTLCAKYNVKVISDEIHCDLIYPGNQHLPFSAVNKEFAANSVVCTAPSKTFNLAGIQASNIIIPNDTMRWAFRVAQAQAAASGPNIFALAAVEAAYCTGADWLNQLIAYLAGNLSYLNAFVQEHLPAVRAIQPEGTYLVWLDCRNLSLDGQSLREFMLTQAKVAFNEGYTFGPGGEGFERVNIACPRSVLAEGLNRLATAVDSLHR